MKFNTLILCFAASTGLASTANADSTVTFNASDHSSSHPPALRNMLLGDRKLDAGNAPISKMTHADIGVSTALLCFTPAGGITSDDIVSVAFYDVKTGVWSHENKPKVHAISACLNELKG